MKDWALVLFCFMLALSAFSQKPCQISKLVIVEHTDVKGEKLVFKDTTSLIYDSTGRVTREESTIHRGSIMNYTYDGNTVICRFSAGFEGLDTVLTQIFNLNQNGDLISSYSGPELTIDTITLASHVSNYLRNQFSFFEYDKDDHLTRQVDTFPDLKNSASYIYEWKGGNKVREQHFLMSGMRVSETIFDYYTDMKFQPTQFILTRQGKSNNNMLKSETISSQSGFINKIEYGYQFDAKGMVNKVIAKMATGAQETDILYTCP